MATQLDETQEARLDVEPLITSVQVTKRVYLDIRFTELDYTFAFDTPDIATFDKDTESIIGLKEGATRLTITAGDLSKTVSITVTPFETIDETTKEINSVGDFKSAIRLIEDGKDLVDGASTNRPHNDISSNLDKIIAIEDTKEFQSLGNWRKDATYNTGDVVSFLSNFYQSKTDNNKGNTPLPPTLNRADKFWQAVTNSKNIEVKDYSLLRRMGDNHTYYHPTTNGKTLRKFKLEANKQYVLLKTANLWPLKEQYGIYLDFSKYNSESLDDDVTYPKISYIEFEVNYKGLRQNKAQTLLPEINIITCQRGVQDRVVEYPKSQVDGGFTTTTTTTFDKYGPYGALLQTALRRDKIITLMLMVKYDCEVILTGEYSTTPYLDAVNNDSVDSSFLHFINHRVRPNGGDLAYDNLGKLEFYEEVLDIKQQWDKGLLLRTHDNSVDKNDLSLLYQFLGNKDKLDAITKTSLLGQTMYPYTRAF